MLNYQKNNISNAKTLRKNMTPWERKLWYTFLKDYPFRFQRQKAIGNYIVDFYCANVKLAIELDGGGHYYPEQQEYDEKRTQALNGLGIIVLRICNTDIDANFPGVCDEIDLKVKKCLEKQHVPFEWKHSDD